jgi:hypothetical protein
MNEKEQKILELMNIVENYYDSNDLTESELMFFHVCCVSSLIKQMNGYTTDFLVKDVNTMLDYLNSMQDK